MKKIIALFMALLLIYTLWVPASAAVKPEKEVTFYFELPIGIEGIPFAGLPDLTGLTLVLTDNAGFTKRFSLPEQSDLSHYAFSDSEGTGSLDVAITSGVYNAGIVVRYETKQDAYIATNEITLIPFDFSFLWNGFAQLTTEMTQGQAQEVAIQQKHEAKALVFTTSEYGWYSFNITGDTTGHPYIVVRRNNVYDASQPVHALYFDCSYAHSVSLQLEANETVYVAATTVGGYYTGSFNITAAPAVLSLPKETIKVRYHGVIPWNEILAKTTYEPRDLNIALSDGNFDPIAAEGWYARERGEYPVTITAPSGTGADDSFHVKVEYDVLQWLCFIFLGGFIWLKFTPFKV